MWVDDAFTIGFALTARVGLLRAADNVAICLAMYLGATGGRVSGAGGGVAAAARQATATSRTTSRTPSGCRGSTGRGFRTQLQQHCAEPDQQSSKDDEPADIRKPAKQ